MLDVAKINFYFSYLHANINTSNKSKASSGEQSLASQINDTSQIQPSNSEIFWQLRQPTSTAG